MVYQQRFDEIEIVGYELWSGIQLSFLSKRFHLLRIENLDDDINDEKSWIQFNFNPENDIELMNGKSGRNKLEHSLPLL